MALLSAEAELHNEMFLKLYMFMPTLRFSLTDPFTQFSGHTKGYLYLLQ